MEILQYAQHLVPDAIQLSDLASARYTVMIQWKSGTITGKTRLVRDQWTSRRSNTIDCFGQWIGVTKFRLVDCAQRDLVDLDRC